MEKRPALGKGLSALIPDAADALTTPRASLEVDIDLLEPNHYQPRGPMDAERLAEAPSHGLPAVTYDARSRGAEAYFAFAREVLERNQPALA